MTDSIAAIAASWQAHGDPANRLINTVSTSVKDALSEMGRPFAQRADRLTVGILDRYDSIATVAAYDDASGLAILSDALCSLIDYVAQIASCWLHPADLSSLWRLNRNARRTNRQASVMRDPWVQASAGLLRYYMIHQRFFGLPGKLGILADETTQKVGHTLTLAALQFVVAHEAAHFVLGHDENVHESKRQFEQEFEADLLALEVSRHTLPEQEWFGLPLPILGARLALMAVEATEIALFIRTPTTHPTSYDRWTRLSAVSTKQEVESATALTRGAAAAIGRAQQVAHTLRDEEWSAMLTNTTISKRAHADEYYRMIVDLDRFAGVDRARLVDGLLNVRSKTGTDVLEPLLLIDTEGIDVALRRYGMDERVVCQALDPNASLSFFTFIRALRDSPGLSTCGTDTGILLTAALAVLLLDPFLPRRVSA
jgi:Peptidase U49